MYIEIDFNSDEALYVQLCNQIIMEIAMERISEGDTLPSVRQLADTIGINMHTVNKAYAVLREEGYLTLDRRRGAIIVQDCNKSKAISDMREALRMTIARGVCKNISKDEVHRLVEEIFEEISI